MFDKKFITSTTQFSFHPSLMEPRSTDINFFMTLLFTLNQASQYQTLCFLPKPSTSTPISVKDNCHPSRHASQNSGSPLTIQSPTPHIKSTGKSVYVYISRIHHWTQQEDQRQGYCNDPTHEGSVLLLLLVSLQYTLHAACSDPIKT